MPMYSWSCASCGTVRDEIRTIAERDEPLYCMCRSGGVLMVRDMVYAFRTAPNEASNWPYVSHSLVPEDKRLLAKYRKEGRLTADGGLKIDSAADYRRICKEQGVKPMGDYEKINKSVTRPYVGATKRAKQERRAKMRERVAKKIAERGVSLGG